MKNQSNDNTSKMIKKFDQQLRAMLINELEGIKTKGTFISRLNRAGSELMVA